MSGVIIFFLLFLVAFIVFPFGGSQFEIPKVVISEIAIGILLVSVLLNPKKNRQLDRRFLVLIVGLILITLLGLLLNPTSLAFFW